MKNIFILLLILLSCHSVFAQNARTNILEDLENRQVTPQENQPAFTATIKTATRLFSDKDDLTSVITVIPSGSEVEVFGSDSTYLRVGYEEVEGFILKRHAVTRQTPFSSRAPVQSSGSAVQPKYQSQPQSQPQPQPQPQQDSRFTYLENKYGTSMASSLIAGKIWRGMSREMVRDSWGKPLKINRVISGNTIKEEWIYKNTWLYIEDDELMTWGPVKR